MGIYFVKRINSQVDCSTIHCLGCSLEYNYQGKILFRAHLKLGKRYVPIHMMQQWDARVETWYD